MDFTNYWTSSGTNQGGGGGGDAGDPIGQSLRFRGGTGGYVMLTCDMPNSTQADGTVSFWFKPGNQTATTTANGTGGLAYAMPQAQGVDFRIANFGDGRFNDGNGYISDSRFRDHSAWYNIVLSYDLSTTTLRTFVNGELLATQSKTYTSAFHGTQFQIGQVAHPNYAANLFQFDGYIADYHYVNDQVLDPTTFGRFNANGVWVPVDPKKDGDTAWYGTNGYHLTFADPLDVGKDYSGNGNDFTATGFDTVGQGATGYYANAVTAATGGEIPNGGTPYCVDIEPATADIGYFNNSVGPGNAGNTADVLFDGKLDTWLYWAGTLSSDGNVVQFRIDLRDFTADGITKVECLCSAPSLAGAYDYQLLDASKVAIPGTSVQPTTDSTANGEWLNIPVSGSPRYLDISSTKGTASRNVLYAIRVNGQILQQEDTLSPTYDLMEDSPTQNYATYNPVQVSPIAGRTPPYANANLTTTWSGGGMPMPATSQFIDVDDTQTYYAEYIVGNSISGNNEAVILGVCSEDYNFADYTGTNNSDNRLKTYINYSGKAVMEPGGDINDIVTNAWTNAKSGGDVVGVEYNNSTRRVKWYINGTIVNVTAPFVVGTHEVEIPQSWGRISFCGIQWGTPTDKGWNFGQQPFQHQPAGTVALQTANIPAAPIANGRDHFQAITGPGDADGVMWKETTISQSNPTDPLALSSELGPWNQTATYGDDPGKSYTVVLNGTQSTFTWRLSSGFTSGAAMYVSEDGITWRNYDGGGLYRPTTGTNWPDLTNFTVDDGTPIKYVRWMAWGQPTVNCGLQNPNKGDGILTVAQQTFPNGLWWIKDRTVTQQHQLVDSVNGTTDVIQCPNRTTGNTYAAPTGDSIAWCWNAENTDGGFSITNGTHGLGVVPAMVIDRNLNVWHQSLPAGQGLILSSSAGSAAQTWTVNETTVTGPGGGTYYTWSEIPGYSAFGKYTGNGNSNGTFVYTGFRPAFVMIKGASNTNWSIQDSTRYPFNPTAQDLIPNNTASESQVSAMPIDLLSNGFKMRTNNATINTSNATYVYAAFAENPFQSPVTAR